jgi:hypothetical protein
LIPARTDKEHFVDYLLAVVQAEIEEAVRERREEGFTSSVSTICGALLAETPGYTALHVMLHSPPLSLRRIAVACGYGRRSVLREGSIRNALERLQRAGVVINVGTQTRPRFTLAHDEQLRYAVAALGGSPSTGGILP